MARRLAVPLEGTTAHLVSTDGSDGCFRPLPPIGDGSHPEQDEHAWAAALAERRRNVVAGPWTWLRQVHGARVVTARGPGDMAGAEADGAVTTSARTPLAVTTADCAPVVLVAERGIAVVHAGWRGLVSGIVDHAASQLRAIAGAPVTSVVGPCISAAAYEFGADDLDVASRALGEAVRGETSWGTPALDVPAAVVAACDRAGWPPPDADPVCTSGAEWFSHRTRGDTGRQVTVAWLQPDGDDGQSP